FSKCRSRCRALCSLYFRLALRKDAGRSNAERRETKESSPKKADAKACVSRREHFERIVKSLRRRRRILGRFLHRLCKFRVLRKDFHHRLASRFLTPVHALGLQFDRQLGEYGERFLPERRLIKLYQALDIIV